MPPRAGTMRNRWTAYAVLSTALAAGVVLKSLAQRPNFYSAAVYLSQSSANLMILCNLVFVTACSILLALQQTLYGPLRPIEIEQLYEKAWFAVTETCLAMTIFRGEIGAWFLVMFFSLLAGKVWGWIGEGRVEVLEQQQHNVLVGNNRLIHTRLVISLALSVLFDVCMLDYTVGQVLHMARPDMMVMFGFEFAVLTISSTSTALRYTLNLVESSIIKKQKQKRIEIIRKERIEAARDQVRPQNSSDDDGPVEDEAVLEQRRTDAEALAAAEPIDDADVEVEGWEGKGRWTFYLDLTTDFCKLCIYLSFFFILLIFYGLPLHIMRDVFLTCRSFFKRIGDFVRYRNATRDMNERYPDATEAEIQREDVCIICREDMRVYTPPGPGVPLDPMAERMRPKKLPCGHVLHFSCLRSWLERQQICPTCRANVAPTQQTQHANAQAPQAAQPPQDRANRGPRVYQLGPLRIGMGAVRGNDLFEQLNHHLGDQNQQQAAAPALAGAGAQQYGFGIRWGAARRRNEGSSRGHRPIDEQLSSLERQLQREADALQTSLGELQALRHVQAQLTRIRMARDAPATQPANNASQPRPMPMQQVATPFRVAQQHNVLQAGSDQLPAGLTLPDGWSMIPLEPARNPLQQLNSMQVPMVRGTFQSHNTNLPSLRPQNPYAPSDQPWAGSNWNGVPANLPDPPLISRDASQRSRHSNSAQHQSQGQTTSLGRSTSNDVQASSAASASTLLHRPQADRPAPTGQHHDIPDVFRAREQRANVPTTASPLTSGYTGAHESQASPAHAVTIDRSAPVQPPALASTTRTSRSVSPHKATRSIGSSWGFTNADIDNNNSDEEDEDDEDDNDEDADDNGDGYDTLDHGPVNGKGKTKAEDSEPSDPDDESNADSDDDDDDDEVSEEEPALSANQQDGRLRPHIRSSRAKNATVEDSIETPD